MDGATFERRYGDRRKGEMFDDAMKRRKGGRIRGVWCVSTLFFFLLLSAGEEEEGEEEGGDIIIARALCHQVF